jgi:hypothetical protein
MSDFFNFLFHPLSNGIMTVLTGMTSLYWVFTLIAGDFLGDLDFAPEVDTGIDISPDTDVDVDGADGGAEQGWFSKAMDYVNVGRVPFMVVYSTFKFIAWIITLLSSVFLNLASWGWKSALILIPVFALAFFVTRLVTKPLVKVYKAMGYNGDESPDLLGRIAKMRSSVTGDKIGAAEIVVNNDVIRLNVKSKSGETINYNADVMIADESKEGRFYYVVPDINLNNIV